jgi:hypothetical protein
MPVVDAWRGLRQGKAGQDESGDPKGRDDRFVHTEYSFHFRA